MTTAPKSRYLQSLSNIDLAHRNKKVITTPTRPASLLRVSRNKDAHAPVELPFTASKPAADVAPKPVHVRKIYEREFLLKFKYAFTDFPRGIATPEELVLQYNKDLEIREARDRQTLSESSSLFANKPKEAKERRKDGSATVKDTTTTANAAKEKVVEKKLKLRIPSSKVNLSRLPMFAPKPEAAQPSHQAANTLDNKENTQLLPSQENAPVVLVPPVKKLKQQIPPTVPSSSSSQIVIDIEKKENRQPNVPVVAEIKPEQENVVSPPAIVEVLVPPADEKPIDAALEELTKKMKGVLREDDPRRLAQRQKQIEYGKNTVGYSTYTNSVPRCKRKRDDPKTPNKFQICSKRSWDGQIRKWRRMLHFYDPKGLDPVDDDFEMLAADNIQEDAANILPELQL